MKKKSCILWALLAASLLPVSARPYLHDLDIRVVLSPEGDARITETRLMDIDDEGTECYIVVGNLNGSDVCDLEVSDEQGTVYENVGDWDINLSRQRKNGRCGIIRKHDGYELCWGLGDSGRRTYTTSYTLTHLVRSYNDADGFNHMFVAEGLNPKPDHVKLTIVTEGFPEDTLVEENAETARLTTENTGVWAFRYRGDVNVVDGNIVAESSEPFSSGSAMIVMARFDKGLFTPSATVEDSFDKVRNLAFEGSDYLDDSSGNPFAFLLFILTVFLLPLLLIFSYLFYVWHARRKVMKDLLWYRDIPANGNLQWANDALNAFRYFGTDYNNLLSACILKLIDMGAVGIEKSMNAKGKTVQNFVIQPLKDADKLPQLLRMVHDIFQRAAGSDTILEPKELKSWMRQTYNQSTTDRFIQTLHTKTSIYQYSNQIDEVRHLFGLKKFLKEFSLLDERHVSEVSLWKDYMIYATLFGNADQVIKDMKAINPEYFNMDKVAEQMADTMTLPTIRSVMQSSTTRAAMSKAEREARASGKGGHASWGGGGGFSGGGFGGGVR